MDVVEAVAAAVVAGAAAVVAVLTAAPQALRRRFFARRSTGSSRAEPSAVPLAGATRASEPPPIAIVAPRQRVRACGRRAGTAASWAWLGFGSQACSVRAVGDAKARGRREAISITGCTGQEAWGSARHRVTGAWGCCPGRVGCPCNSGNRAGQHSRTTHGNSWTPGPKTAWSAVTA